MIFSEKGTWPIVYYPEKIAKDRGVGVVDNNKIEWACAGCFEEICDVRQVQYSFAK
jgi:hypothetical protein